MNSQTPSSIDTGMGPGEVGDLLRASRVRQGQELADVARALRIRIVYLQAIEDSRFEDLPGAVYALGFIRSYADHLGLDGEQLVARFKSEGAGQGRKPILTFPTIVPENGIPRGAVISIGGLILLAAYAGWYFLSSKDLYVADLIPPVPETIARAIDAGRADVAKLAEPKTDAAAETVAAASQPAQTSEPTSPPLPASAAASASVPAPSVALPNVASGVAPPPVAQQQPAASLPAPAAAAPDTDADTASSDDGEVDSTPPPSPASPQTADASSSSGVASGEPSDARKPSAVAAAPAGPVMALDDRGGVDAPAVGSQLANLPGLAVDPEREIVLTATIDSWIQIRDSVENRLILTRLLRKGEKYTVPPRDGLTLVTGNAGGLEITVGGQTAPSLGPLGVVRRNVVLDPDRLRAGNAIIE